MPAQKSGPAVPRGAVEDSIATEIVAQPEAEADAADEAESERDAWVVLLSVPGLGPATFGALLSAFGSGRAALDAACGPDGTARLSQALADARAGDDGLSDATFDVVAAGGVARGRSTEGSGPAAAGSPGPPGAGGATSPLRRQGIGSGLATRICEAALSGARVVERVRALGLAVVTLEESRYPERLRGVEMPPPILFVRGSVAAMSGGKAVAVVGTRRPTDKGRLIAGWIGSAIARTGSVVVSGLAVGIDGAAHAAVVAEGGRTVAVLGGGHARLFPRAHDRLADAIVQAGGAVVSELAPDTSPSRGTFPRRNRLVSGLSDATIVVEAGRRSGALITAGWALEQGRECFLVPGPFDAPTSAGCHAFLRSFPGQARVVCGIAELIEDLELDGGEGAGVGTAAGRTAAETVAAERAPAASIPGAGRSAVLASLGPVERALAEQLERGPATADQLALRTSLPGAVVLSGLTLLELRGLVRGAYGRYSPSGSLARWSRASQEGGD